MMQMRAGTGFWMATVAAVLTCAWAGSAVLHGEDWPYFRGKGNTGVWEETGILEKFPEEGLASRVRWRTPVRWGYSGPAVANGRVFITDFMYTTRPRGVERALALDEKTGKVLWTTEWDVNYTGLSYERGPRTTPTVDDDRVYIQGANGTFLCLNVETGAILWKHESIGEYHAPVEHWASHYGFVAPLFIDGDHVIVKVGGQEKAKIMAFDKRTGKEIWRSLTSEMGIGSRRSSSSMQAASVS